MRRLLLPVVATLLTAACSTAASTPGDSASTVSTPSASATPTTSASSTPAVGAARTTRQVVFFGDSYFVGGGCSPKRSRDMAAIAGNLLGYRPVVRGFGGTGFVATNPDYGGPDYLTQVTGGALAADHPSLVVIEGGDNDIGFPVDQIDQQARKVLKFAQHLYPDANLVLMGAMQTYGDFSQTDGINTGLRAVAKKLGVSFINPQKWTFGHDDYLCSDYVHPTYDAHQILGAKLAKKLAKRGA